MLESCTCDKFLVTLRTALRSINARMHILYSVGNSPECSQVITLSSGVYAHIYQQLKQILQARHRKIRLKILTAATPFFDAFQILLSHYGPCC